jgi:dolichol-phosphate mannosyltransferase
MSPKTIVVVPTYNELANLRRLIHELRNSNPGLYILIVDDNSPDGTGTLADELATRHPGEVIVIHRPRKDGLGRAYLEAFDYSLAMNYEVVVQMDADFSHCPAEIPRFLLAMQDHDLVIGSRYLNPAGVAKWSFERRMLSKWGCTYVRLITGMPFTDLTSGYKCWRAEALRTIGFSSVLSAGYFFQVETTHRAHRMGCRIVEIPIIFGPRQAGRSKMSFPIVAEALWGAFRLLFSSGRATSPPPRCSDGPSPKEGASSKRIESSAP